MPLRPRVAAVLFDFDGTVADTHGLTHRCLDETAMQHLGVPFPLPLLEQHVGRPLADLFALLRDGRAQAATPIEVLVATYRAKQIDYEAQVAAYPGVAEALQALRERSVRLAIVTTKLRSVARRQLQRTGLAECFEVIVGFDDCAQSKPDPEPFQRALHLLGVTASAAVAVGDSPGDIHAARAAGVTAVAALWGCLNRAALLTTKPDRTLSHPAELRELVR